MHTKKYVVFLITFFALLCGFHADAAGLNPGTFIKDRIGWSCVITPQNQKDFIATAKFSVLPRQRAYYMSYDGPNPTVAAGIPFGPKRLITQTIFKGNMVYIKQNTSSHWVAYPAMSTDAFAKSLFTKGMLADVDNTSLNVKEKNGVRVIYAGKGVESNSRALVTVFSNKTIERVEETLHVGQGSPTHKICTPLSVSSVYVTPPKNFMKKKNSVEANTYLMNELGKSLPQGQDALKALLQPVFDNVDTVK